MSRLGTKLGTPATGMGKTPTEGRKHGRTYAAFIDIRKGQKSYGVTEKKEKEETPKAAVGIVLLVCYGACSSCSNSTFHLF